jgi:hypothetical protein
MKGYFDSNMQQIVTRGPTRSPHGNLPLPGGKTAAQVEDTTRILVGLGIPGTSHDKGRDANLAAYAAYLEQIHKVAGDAAVSQWLEKSK